MVYEEDENYLSAREARQAEGRIFSTIKVPESGHDAPSLMASASHHETDLFQRYSILLSIEMFRQCYIIIL